MAVKPPDFIAKITSQCVEKLPEDLRNECRALLIQTWVERRSEDYPPLIMLKDGRRAKFTWTKRSTSVGWVWTCTCEIILHHVSSSGIAP
jgi:hypothetical protein